MTFGQAGQYLISNLNNNNSAVSAGDSLKYINQRYYGLSGLKNKIADWLTGTYKANVNAFNTALENNLQAAATASERDWTERMSNSEIQRRMADLEAAGLNPYAVIGSGGLGSGASTGSTSAQSVKYDEGTEDNPGTSLRNVVSALATTAMIVARLATKV